MAQIIIVSNRLPVSVKRTDGKLEFYQSIGGLARGLSSYAKNKKYKWIGWPGIASDDLTELEKRAIARELLKSSCYPIFLTQRQLDDYYNGYSNTILWPLFHNLHTDYDKHDRYWKGYKEVNQIFTDATLALSKPGSNIWIHDYLLLLMPGQLRQERPRDSIGLFLHIPFPDKKTFEDLPSGKKLLRGMLGADLLGFHTQFYVTHFLDNIDRVTAAIVTGTDVIVEGRVIRVTDFPIGIDYAKFARGGNSKLIRKHAASHRRKYGNRKIILTVDRLDPTKGLVERLQAYREFLKTNSQLHNKVMLVMLAMPSRTDVKEYQQLKVRVEKLVHDINETYGSKLWKPVDYMYKAIPVEEVTALYQIAHVAFITPLRDGMNLVAKEYVASQINKNGVLILSTTAGAAQELQDAILVNPNQRASLVGALTKAITMPKIELQKRLSAMQKQIAKNTIQDWAGSFMDTLQKSSRITLPRTRLLSPSLQLEIINSYKRAGKRVLLLDYDGVLADFEDNPSHARPTDIAYNLLQSLGENPQNDVAIISGRHKDILDKWLGYLPITLIAEHGTATRNPSGHWHSNVHHKNGWKKDVLKLMDKYAAVTPGAFVEQKETSIVWHFRKTPLYYAQASIIILKQRLKKLLHNTEFDVYSGNRILEVKARSANKGLAVEQWLKGSSDFILAIGDDYTDEDMFDALPAYAFTIKVGRGRTNARYRMYSVKEVLQLLKKLS